MSLIREIMKIIVSFNFKDIRNLIQYHLQDVIFSHCFVDILLVLENIKISLLFM